MHQFAAHIILVFVISLLLTAPTQAVYRIAVPDESSGSGGQVVNENPDAADPGTVKAYDAASAVSADTSNNAQALQDTSPSDLPAAPAVGEPTRTAAATAEKSKSSNIVYQGIIVAVIVAAVVYGIANRFRQKKGRSL